MSYPDHTNEMCSTMVLFQITLILLFRCLRGRHKCKIQLSIELPVQTAHTTYPMRETMCVFFKINKNPKKVKCSILAKTLSAAFLKLHTERFIMFLKLRGQRGGENKKDRAAGVGGGEGERGEGRGGVHLHTMIIHKDIGT